MQYYFPVESGKNSGRVSSLCEMKAGLLVVKSLGKVFVFLDGVVVVWLHFLYEFLIELHGDTSDEGL